MKPKRTQQNQKPRNTKAQRDSLDRRIAKASTVEGKKRVALYGQREPLSRIRRLVDDWQLVNYLRDHPEHAPKEKIRVMDGITGVVVLERDPSQDRWKRATKSALDFMHEVFRSWNYEAVSALANEMKLAAHNIRHEPDKKRWLLLHGVPVNSLARQVVDNSFAKTTGPLSKEATERIKRTREKRLASTTRALRRTKANWRKWGG